MPKNPKLPKRMPKTREQILAELKTSQNFVENMKFTKEVFYPALCKATDSIEDAKQNLSIISGIVTEKFLGLMKEKKFGELNIESFLSKEDPHYEGLKSMLELFSGYSIFDAKSKIEGMKSELDLFVTEELKKRPLSSLTCTWVDELK